MLFVVELQIPGSSKKLDFPSSSSSNDDDDDDSVINCLIKL